MEQVGVFLVCWQPSWVVGPHTFLGRKNKCKRNKVDKFLSLSLSGKGFGRSTQGPLRSLIRGRPSGVLCWKVWDRPQTGSLPWAASSKACGLGSVRWKTRAWVYVDEFASRVSKKSFEFTSLVGKLTRDGWLIKASGSGNLTISGLQLENEERYRDGSNGWNDAHI